MTIAAPVNASGENAPRSPRSVDNTGVSSRHTGHLGESYVPELIELAGRAAPLGAWPLFRVDTTRPLDLSRLMGWIESLQ